MRTANSKFWISENNRILQQNYLPSERFPRPRDRGSLVCSRFQLVPAFSELYLGICKGFALTPDIKVRHTFHRVYLSSILVYFLHAVIPFGHYARPVRWQSRRSQHDQRCRLLLAPRCTSLATRPLNQDSHGLIAEHPSFETIVYSILGHALYHGERTDKDQRAAHAYPGDA
ncbi:hypothetical protein FOXYSP1_16784 [Fusarium oxysporum f. sp. phaseoli]